MSYERTILEVDVAIHIPEGYRLSVEAMAGLMNKSSQYLYKVDDNMYVVCSSEVFDSLESSVYHLLGVRYQDHMYEHDAPSDTLENVLLSPISMWDEYTEYIEVSI